MNLDVERLARRVLACKEQTRRFRLTFEIDQSTYAILGIMWLSVVRTEFLQ